MTMSNLIYSAEPGLIIGFHGCDQSIRDKVLIGETKLRVSNNIHDWLGSGFYFWQNNFERALDFATRSPGKSKKISQPAVLGAVLDLGNCLDLTDKRWIDLVKESYENFKETTELEGNKLPVNANQKNDPHSNDKVLRKLDCAVIENIHRIVGSTDPFDSVRGMFIEGNALYEGAGFYEKTNVQICIRNPKCIKGFFMPRAEVKWP